MLHACAAGAFRIDTVHVQLRSFGLRRMPPASSTAWAAAIAAETLVWDGTPRLPGRRGIALIDEECRDYPGAPELHCIAPRTSTATFRVLHQQESLAVLGTDGIFFLPDVQPFDIPHR